MTKETLQELMPVFQAWIDGKTIQSAGKHTNYEQWTDNHDFDPLDWAFDGSLKFRVKPEPKLRPRKPEEGVGKVVRSKTNGNIAIVTGWNAERNGFAFTGEFGGFSPELRSPEYLLEHATELDGSPCGVIE